MEGKTIPSFSFLLLDSVTRITTDSIRSGEPFVIFYFSPHCPYCKAELQDIILHAGELRQTKIYLLTAYPLREVRDFFAKNHLENYSNIICGLDNNYAFIRAFYAVTVPFLAFFDKDKRLKQVLVGPSDYNTIQSIIST